MKENINVIARFAALFIVLLNMGLTAFGMNPIGASEDTVYEFVSIILTFGVAAWTAWKNNSVTKAAKAGDTVMELIKAGVIAEQDVIELLTYEKEKDDVK